ncbi:hypothetical protein [Roseibium marinum]|uniref:hypothetical protein n=1 Tax=Roseibium marinum TaxID=281252 RepID=UPI0011AF8681|nr:hypothetical protein [Roseibium marinum]
MKYLFCVFSIVLIMTVNIQGAFSKDFRYHKSVSLNVGQSLVLKGVRSRDCDDKAPSWSHIKKRLPSSSTGKFSDGGAGTVKSSSCGGRVGARGILFTAEKLGKEQLSIFGDDVRISVR